jgi:hypothetical protein
MEDFSVFPPAHVASRYPRVFNEHMNATEISANDVEMDDYLIITNDYRSRFAIKVETIAHDRKYVVGRVFSIATLDREGLVVFSGCRKMASLRPATRIERVA